MDTPHSKFKKINFMQKKRHLYSVISTRLNVQHSLYSRVGQIIRFAWKKKISNLTQKKLTHIPNKMAELGIHNISKDSGNKIHYM